MDMVYAGGPLMASTQIPESPRLSTVIDELLYPGCTGKVFHIASPRIALANACERLGLPHMRLHDLRHFFATFAIESGVDVPTVAKWLGHQDGGVLAMKTYGHSRDDHGLAQAKLLKSADADQSGHK